ncbi:hypothetical protein QYF36_020887 [Acer negundo]|nr:hypothetical protein QYF36_020887 [Acer negundo]
MNDGTIDSLKLKIINQLEANNLKAESINLECSFLSTLKSKTWRSCQLVWLLLQLFHKVQLQLQQQLRCLILQEELKNTTIKMAEQSKVLNTPGAEKLTKRELFDALWQEFETPCAQESLLISLGVNSQQ